MKKQKYVIFQDILFWIYLRDFYISAIFPWKWHSSQKSLFYSLQSDLDIRSSKYCPSW